MISSNTISKDDLYSFLTGLGYSGSIEDMLYTYYKVELSKIPTIQTNLDNLSLLDLERLYLLYLTGYGEIVPNRLSNSDLIREAIIENIDLNRMPIFYFDSVKSSKDIISGANLITQKSDISWTEDRLGNIVEVPANKPTIHPKYGLRSNDSYTNLIYNSEDLTIWNGTNIRVSVDYEDGFFKLTKLTTTPWDRCSLDLNSVSANTILNFSFEVKKGGINKGALYLYDVTEDNLHKLNYHCFYNIDTETIYEEYLAEPDTADLIKAEIYNKVDGIYIVSVSIKIKYDFPSIQVGFTPQSDIIGQSCFIRRPQVVANKQYPMPYIPTTGTIKSSPVEYATSTTGNKFLLTDIPSVTNTLGGNPTRLDAVLYKNYDYINTTYNKGIINPVDSHTRLIYNGYGRDIGLNDGSNVSFLNLSSFDMGWYYITVLWDNNYMQLIINGNAIDKVAFDGSFDPATYLNFFWVNKELWYLRKLAFYPLKDTDWIV